ncbi:hypothetical protein [Pedobacter caeni]|uniref:Uncharacterized protein n=1 Tax=Pedobacter caeni TaxID=288992 RepID=A0A1M5G1G9_9SPHI|nr:hypothetical protein [Pedobacter caeni]SHF97650.1 hypothetical protein SAMN04488522_10417 [Pedobacter caeni]
MKNKFILAVFAVVIMTTSACKKDNEIPPRQEGYIIEYLVPPPTFLTDSERALLDAKRDEWDNS